MSVDLQEILGVKNLTGIIEEVTNGIPDNVLPPAFYRPTRRVEKDYGNFMRYSGTRKVAKQVPYGSPSARRIPTGVTEVPFKSVYSFEHEFHTADTLMNLQRFDSPQLQQLGEQEVARRVREFGMLFKNLKLASIYSALALGHIYFDSDGNLLPSSTGYTVDIDFSVPTSNRDQFLMEDGSTSIISADWDEAATDIVSQINNLKNTAIQRTGYPLKYALYGRSVLGYFMANTAIANIFSGSGAWGTSFGSLEIPANFLGLTWIPVMDAFFQDSNGTNQSFFNYDTVVFTPDPAEGGWWEFVEGSIAVPTTIDIAGADANAARATINKAYGTASWAKVVDDPVGIKHYAAYNAVPLITNPSAIFIGDVKAT